MLLTLCHALSSTNPLNIYVYRAIILTLVLAIDRNDKEAFICKIVALIHESEYEAAVSALKQNAALR